MLLFSLVLSFAFAQTDRIQSTYKDLGVVERIYLSPGLFTVIDFPKPILEIIGQTKYLKAEISLSNPKSVTLYLIQPTAQPSNMIIKSERRVYIYDVIPSKFTHQDYIKVTGAYGGPSLKSTKRLLDSRELEPAQRVEPIKLERIEEESL